MAVVCVRKKVLNERGIADFTEWNSLENTIYIGRNMDFYVKGAKSSKWRNPFSVKKYGRDGCLEKYEEYIRNSDLIHDIEELRGKELGCWCKPEKCHGDILVKILKESE